jgi:hypothetical protein
MLLRRTIRRIGLAFLSTMVLSTYNAKIAAQSSEDSPGEGKGFALYQRFQGSSNTLGQITKLDTTLGYNFNQYFGIDAGLPFYFVHSSTTSSTMGTSSQLGIGNAYVDLRLTLNNPALNFASTITGTAPTGDTASGFSTGRVTFDWNNHFNRTFSRITPFANIGVANTISDTHFFTRPFSSLGLIGHLEGGATYRILHSISLGLSAYDILPSGQQKIFSKQFKRRPDGTGMQSGASDSPRYGRAFETSSETIGTADIARDNGFSAWFGVSPAPYLDFEVGYNRSVHYSLNTVSFGVGVNLGDLAKKSRH